MKTRCAQLVIFVVMFAWILGAAQEVHADSAWTNKDHRSVRGNQGGAWGRASSVSNRRPTTAEISQALYGTDPGQYDASESVDAPEAEIQTG